ncbi:hypothetical protein ABPG74_014506 [Tetrahymena malaccensis]
MSSPNKSNSRGSKSTQKLEVIDNIIERKIGFGLYQKRALGYLCLIDFNDGLELILMSLTLPIIKSQWNIEHANEVGEGEQYIDSSRYKWLGSIFFLGNLLGALLTGPLSDKFGRRKVVLINSISYGIVAFLFLFVESLGELYVLRFIYGFVYGITLPISTTFYSEITPQKMRGKGVVTINSAIPVGLASGVILAAIVLNDTSSGNWRLLISLSCVPAFILFYGAYKHLLESPRFLVVDKRIQEAADIMNQMITINKGDGGEVVTDDEMEQLEKWRARKYDHFQGMTQIEQVKNQLSLIYIKIFQLFQDKYTWISISLCVQWFGIHFMSIGQTFILPFVQAQQKKGFGDMLLVFFGEIPGVVMTFLIIDRQYFGRKNSLILFFGGCFVLNLLAYYQVSFSFVLSLSRFCYRQCHAVLYVITNEIYETPLRTTGIGVNSAFARFSTVIMPFILVAIFDASTYGPFLCLSIIAAVCALMAYKLPFDTTNIKLDHIEEELEQRTHPLDTIKEENMSSSQKSNNSHQPNKQQDIEIPLIQQK